MKNLVAPRGAQDAPEMVKRMMYDAATSVGTPNSPCVPMTLWPISRVQLKEAVLNGAGTKEPNAGVR